MPCQATSLEVRGLPRWRWYALGALLLLVGSTVWAQQAPQRRGALTARRFDAVEESASLERLREGTQLVDQPGSFQRTSGRLVFQASDGRRYVGLENLNLERVAQVVVDNPAQLDWFVSGTVTEYRGSNYLLIKRATLRSQPAVRAGG